MSIAEDYAKASVAAILAPLGQDIEDLRKVVDDLATLAEMQMVILGKALPELAEAQAEVKRLRGLLAFLGVAH